MKPLKITAIAYSFGFCSPAFAGPVYLTCAFPDRPSHDLQVTLDEQGGTASVYLASTGYTEQFKAAFGPETISFQGRFHEYLLNRVDQTLRRTIRMLKGSASAVDVATCVIRKTPKRAF